MNAFRVVRVRSQLEHLSSHGWFEDERVGARYVPSVCEVGNFERLDGLDGWMDGILLCK